MRFATRPNLQKRISPFLSVIMAACVMAASCALMAQTPAPAHVSALTITSPSISEGGQIPSEFTCVAGPASKSPKLEWSGVPAESKSLVVYLHDLDPHPNGGADDVLHWIAWNIPTSMTGLPGGVKPEIGGISGATQGVNTHATVGYFGPCPPPGTARSPLRV